MFVMFCALFLLYNANGREIGSADTQPAKFTAQAIATEHTLRLDTIVAERPGLAERPAFARDREGHWWNAYPIEPALFAGALALLLHTTHLVDMAAPLAPNLVAALTASLLTAAAVTLVFVALRRIVPPGAALVTTIALGAGTNYWPVVSRTLWQHECVAFGTALALWAWLRPRTALGIRDVCAGGCGLAIAVAARWQILPMAAMMLAWTAVRVGARRTAAAAALVAGILLLVAGFNVERFGDVRGGAVQIAAAQYRVHAVRGSIATSPLAAAAGLLISPSRGILVFSPVVVVALLAPLRVRRPPQDFGLAWLWTAALVQFLMYSTYSVWWGGHTYGPRYLLDVLVPLAPWGALGAAALASRTGRVAGAILLSWSILVAAAGAFIYPTGVWNIDPVDVDRAHERLWEVRDSQIPRTLASPWSPQNFGLFSREAFRR
jgi:hypothetical protein